MPGMGGLETCRAIRSGWDVPIIVVSVRESDRDKVEALDAGADDFVSKPFSFDELLARIRAALRRTGFATDSTPKRISAPGLEIDFEQRRIVAGGRTVRLTPTEFDILRYLVSQANKPVPHRRLLQAIWGPDCADQIEYLRVFINQLRKKIEPPGPKPTFITTEPRVGYRFVLETAPVAADFLLTVGVACTRRPCTLNESGCGAAWLARLLGVQEVASSNLASPTKIPQRLTGTGPPQPGFWSPTWSPFRGLQKSP